MVKKYRSTSIHVRPSTETLRNKLEESAAANKRSLAAEIELRLEQSFENDVPTLIDRLESRIDELEQHLLAAIEKK